MKGYKAFNKDMTCSPNGNKQQYKEGETYEFPEIKICENGAHFCENPLDLLSYYDLCDSVFCDVESLGDIERHLDNNDNPVDSKIVTNKIKIGARLDLKGFIEAGVNYVLNVCKEISSGNDSQNASSGYNSQNASSGNDSKNASSGYNSKNASSGNDSQNASSGYNSKNASSGYKSQNASSGYGSKNASSGDWSKNASSGDKSQNASSGNDSQNASSGDNSQNASSGDNSQNASSGYKSQIEMTGKYNVGASIGIDNKIKGIKGNWITLAEYKYDAKENATIPVCVKSAQIDGINLKENVWYKLIDGEFKEA